MCNILRALYSGFMARPPAPVVKFLLDMPTALIQGIASEVHDVEGIMTALAPGSSSAAALLNPVNPSIATISMRSRHV